MINLNEMKRDYIGREPRDYIVESVTVPEGLEEKVLAAMTQKRKEIEEIQKEKQEKKAAHKSVALRAAVIAAVIILMILVIPSSRQVVVNAAESVIKWFASWSEFKDDSETGTFDSLELEEKFDEGGFIINEIKENKYCKICFVGATVTNDTVRLGFVSKYNCENITEYILGTITDSDGNSVDFRCSDSEFLTTFISVDGERRLYSIPIDNLKKNLNDEYENYKLDFSVLLFNLNLDSEAITNEYFSHHPYKFLENKKLFNQSSLSDISFSTKVKNTYFLENTVSYDISKEIKYEHGITLHVQSISFAPSYTELQMEFAADEQWKLDNYVINYYENDDIYDNIAVFHIFKKFDYSKTYDGTYYDGWQGADDDNPVLTENEGVGFHSDKSIGKSNNKYIIHLYYEHNNLSSILKAGEEYLLASDLDQCVKFDYEYRDEIITCRYDKNKKYLKNIDYNNYWAPSDKYLYFPFVIKK